MKRILLIILSITLLAVGGVSAYFYLDAQKGSDLTNEMFVDRGENYEYAAMYDLLKGL